jgi:serine/threonine-protein kinase RsbT
MPVLKTETMPLRDSDDVVRARQAVRAAAAEQGFNLVEQTKLVTAASELARNVVTHGRGGELRIEVVNDGHRLGVRLAFEDHGPGIADIQLALKDGYTTSGGLGLGLGGARRLSNEFQIESQPNQGTRVVMVRWKSEL